MAFDRSIATLFCSSTDREGKSLSLSSMKRPSGRTTNFPQCRQFPSPSCAQTTFPQPKQLLISSCFCAMQQHFTLCMYTSLGLAFSFFINKRLQLAIATAINNRENLKPKSQAGWSVMRILYCFWLLLFLSFLIGIRLMHMDQADTQFCYKLMESVQRILLIGANGVVGKFLVRQLAPKFQTVALLRSQPKFDASLYPKLKLIQGDASRQEDLDKATEGVSIIISTYQDAKADPNDALNYVNRVIAAMKKNSVKRFISVCGFGLVRTQGGAILKDTENFPPQFKRYSDDTYNGNQAIAATELSYTYIGCPVVKQEEKEGDYHVFDVMPKEVKWQVKAGHIAHFIQGEVLNPKWERKIIGIANL